MSLCGKSQEILQKLAISTKKMIKKIHKKLKDFLQKIW